MSFDPYRILGVNPSANADELKSAWHARIKIFHPDTLGSAPEHERKASEEMTKLLNAAYEMAVAALSSPARQRQQWPHAQPRRPSPADDPDQRRKHSGPSWSESAKTWRSSRDDAPDATRLLRQASVSTDYAAGLFDRWRQTVRGFRNAEKQFDDSLSVALSRFEEVSKFIVKCRSIETIWLDALKDSFLDSFFAGVLTHLVRAERYVQRLDSVVSNRKMSTKLYNQIESEMTAIHRLYPPKPDAGGHELNRITVLADKQSESLGRDYNDIKRRFVEGRNAFERCTVRMRALIGWQRDAVRHLKDAEHPIERAFVSTATAFGAAEAERTAAKENRTQWLSERTVDAAHQQKERVQALQTDWQQARPMTDELKAALARRRTLWVEQSAGFDELLASEEALAKHLSEALSVLERAGPLIMTLVEQETGPRIAAIQMRLKTSNR
ncbi:MAG: J domain-containing protein [Myxococcota bacterium]|nr:J domain-containing protein [Myxococcota bacterium]